jgi:hypothetical protein
MSELLHYFMQHGYVPTDDQVPDGFVGDWGDGLTPAQRFQNAVIEYAQAYIKDTPAKRWQFGPGWLDNAKHLSAIARALRIDPSQEGASFALWPFRVAHVNGSVRITAAWPCPRTIGAEIDEDHLGIEIVLAWNPTTNSVEIIGDAQGQIVGTCEAYWQNDGPALVFGDARAFFQAWCVARARFWGFAKANSRSHWNARSTEPDLVPGGLIVGDLAKVRWPPTADLPPHIECVGIDPKQVNRAIFASAKLPRVTSSIRAVA